MNFGKYRRLLVFAVIIVLFVTLVGNYNYGSYSINDLYNPSKPAVSKKEQLQSFYAPLFKSITEQGVHLKKIDLKSAADDKGPDYLWNFKELSSRLDIDEETILKYRDIHERVYNSFPNKFPKGLYSGTGVVLMGGDQFTWLSLLSIHSLRKYGSDLPVELIMPTEKDYEQQLCEVDLPKLNAKCVKMYDIFDAATINNLKIKGYQYKSLALIASSFDNLLLLDSDNTLVSNPDEFFKVNPYKDTGLVMWPDYWLRTTSTAFYDIANITVLPRRVRDRRWPLPKPVDLLPDEINNVPLHDLEGALPEMSTESGQLLIRKNDHVKTLLLSLFYNIYGPEIFYRLIGQGQTGEGDKDTFIAAAVKSKESFYQVKSNIRSFGWFEEGRFNGVCMGQKNPVEDYKYFQGFVDHKLDFKDFDLNHGKVFTIHANFPKFNPYKLFKDKKLTNSKGEQIRLYGDIYKFLPLHDDFELNQYSKMNELLCVDKIQLEYFKDKDMDVLCEYVQKHVNFLLKNPPSE